MYTMDFLSEINNLILSYLIKNNYFLNYFFDKILAKYSLKRTKLHHF